MAATAPTTTTTASRISIDHGCSTTMFDCLGHLWDWFDPQENQSHFTMDNSNKATPATQQPHTQHHLMAHHVHPNDQIYNHQSPQIATLITTPQPGQIPPNGVMHQLLQSQYKSNMDARSPLLENRHEVYVTGQNVGYARHYGANENYNYPQSPQRQEAEYLTDHNVNHELLQNMPIGYNAEVYHDYLKRNPPKETNQVYQNNQSAPNRPNTSANTNGSTPTTAYMPYQNRAGAQSNTEILRRQYNELQQMKLQQQMHYQSQAQIFQQQKFAERQLLLQQLHGVQPPPNLQNSIYSDGSFRDFDKYGSRNDFKEYNPADIHKDIDKYVKNNEFREIDKHNQYPQEPKWQTNHQIDYREVERYRKSEPGKTKSQPTVSEFSPQEPKNNVGAGASSPMKSSESSSPSIKSPSTDSRKSSSGGTIRSPIAQRTPSAPVTMAGVLYKQGSDGLKVWRKRWFVLSEYCLFYYKNQEEEKLLGSVLLPSYKVSACTADDRVLRKFAFKLEHANMRTYILAAPDFESMMKWVKTLTMAALMQTPYEPSKERSTVRPEDFEDAGPTYANAPPKPRRSNEGYSSPSPEMYDPNYDLLKKPPSHFNQGTVGEQQPEQTYQTSPNPNAIYARNPQSPPQPGQYQSKRSHDIHNLSLPLTSTTTADSQRANQTIYKSNTHTYYDNRERIQQQLQRAQEEQLYERRSQVTYNPFLQETSIIEPDRPSQVNEMSSDSRVDPNMQYKDVKLETSPRTIRPLPADRVLDRRTPETYGRSTSMSSYNKTKAGDYEDVYGYSSEVGYPNSNNERSSQSQSRDINNAMTINDPPRMAPPEKTFSGPSVLRRKKMQLSGIQPPVPRPHSADFLEYESKNEMMQNKIMPYKDTYDTPKQPQRPKSSLDINSFYDPSSDRYYSEESYAAKMRQSAQYLQAGLGPSNIQIPLAKYASGLAEKQLHSPFTPSVNNNYEIEFASRKPRNSTENLKFKEQEAIHSNWMLKEKENRKDFINRQNIKEDNALLYTKEARQEPLPDGFMRSASARLPTTSGEKEGETKVQQREESMKRLLEWKQRMLQSPLTRKSTPATISLARSLNQSRQSLRSDQYKTKNYGNPPYNNYSSDDEEESTDTEQQITKKVQAGRSQIENISSPTQTHQKTSHSSPPCLDKTQISPKCNNIPLTNDNTYENMSIVNATRQRSLSFGESTYVNTTVGTEDTVVKNFDETSSQDGYETHDSEAESETQLEYTDNDLDEVLNSDEEPVQLDRTDSTLENKTNVSLNTDMVEDNIPSTPPACSAEDHYLPMSPRKVSNVEPAHKTIIENISVFDNSMRHPLEDNPYVEMNLGSEEDEMQNYEVVCVSNDKMEPVYMELGTVSSTDDSSEISSTITRKQVTDTATNFADSNVHTLKRASKGSKKNSPNIMINKSDGSDADDEASKDITLSMPFSRLSISDTFRPASYYLGRSRQSLLSQTYNETGSISPASSTPSLGIDINGEALSQYVLEKLDQSTISQESSILKMLTNENQNMNSAKRKTTSLMIYGSKTSIHDTLSRGEKIRNSRINLTEKNKLLDAKQNLLLNSMMARYDSNRSIEFDTDSLMSFNAERGCSRLSLNSDVSSKFEMTPSHYSSEVVSLNESEPALEYRNLENYRDMETVIKRRPLSEDSFELGAACALESNDVASGIDFDNYLDKLQPDEMRNTVTGRLSLDTSNINTSLKDNLARAANIVSHARCSSTPSNISISNSSILVPKTAIARNFSDQNSGYTGSQSSCSSLGASKSPILYYTKSYDEEKDLSKNLNITDRKNKIVRDKTDLKHANDINISKTHFHSRESSTEQSAPYYYSDLSSQEQINVIPTSHYLKNTNLHRKLNNQRRKISMGKKSEISHIHNPIHSNSLSGESYELASVNRSISVEFLTATDKDLDIDLKNVYASSKGLNSKISDSMKVISNFELNSHDNLGQLNSESCSKNDNPHNTSAKASSTNVSSPCSEHSSNTVYYDAEAEVCAYENMLYHGDNLWEEDKLWRDNLRRVSHRHARSMDDLDTLPSEPFNNEIANTAINSIKRVKKDKKITRNVTYVNCDFQNEIYKKSNDEVHLNQSDYKDKSSDENDVYVSLVKESEVEQSDEGVYEQLVVESSNNSLVTPDTQQKNKMESKAKRRFEIDREKLRQWDLMSSGLMKGAKGVVRGLGAGGLGDALCSTDSGAESASLGAAIMRSGVHANNNYSSNSQSISKKPFLGSNTSIGRNNRENTIPVRAVSPRVRWVEEKQAGEHYGSQLHLSISQQNLYSMGNEDAWANMRSPSRASQQPIRAVSPRIRRNTDNEDIPRNARGLSKSESGVVPTAGELLGRTHEELVLLLIQLRRRHAATHRAIEQCCLQISSIEECLSSLKAMEREESLQRLDQLKMQLMELEHQYEKSKPLVQLVDNMVKLGSLYNRPGSTIERLERNQRLREKVLTEHAMEQQRWLESAAAGKSLETEASRVRVAELWALEQELADEAHLIQGLKTDKDAIESLLTGVRSKFDGMQVSECKTGEDLEAELTRVHAMLALNSKKLEQTVADNARLERELTQLRRALQAQRQSNAPTTPAVATAMLEDEVSRVQQLVSALQRQRQELSRAVRHLTQQSHALQTTHNSLPRSKQQQQQRRPHSSWQETNLDTGYTKDHGQADYDYDVSSPVGPGYYSKNVETPLYVDTRGNGQDVMSPSNSEDLQNSAFNNLSNVEKQEIKTVRIVKRESERRQRDRDRSFQPMGDWPSNNLTNLDQYIDEDLQQNQTYQQPSSVAKTDFSKFEEYYSKAPDTSLYSKNGKDSSLSKELSPRYPSSPSLSTYDYSRDMSSISSSYNKNYDRSTYERTMSASTQYLNSPTDSSRTLTNDPMSKTSSIGSLTRSHMELSPIFKSEAAKQIITEVSGDTIKNGSLHRRQVPKEKRRHYTAPHHLSAKTLSEMPKDMFNPEHGMGRSLDDADMELALRAPPDVVRSALPAQPLRYAQNTIDQLLAAPQKILIPERYIPEKPPELSPEEQLKRQEKVESIKKMLSSSSAADPNKSPDTEEKKQRDHLLQMNQILAKQVTEMSKIIAVKALEELPHSNNNGNFDDYSPEVELPIYQQRENFFT